MRRDKDDPNYFPARQRTYGKTSDCKGCLYWSERNARVVQGKPLEALCLNRDSKMAYLFTTGWTYCKAWVSGEHGAVDEDA